MFKMQKESLFLQKNINVILMGIILLKHIGKIQQNKIYGLGM